MEVEDRGRVDRDAAGADAGRDVGGVLDVLRPDRAAESVGRVVCDRDGLVLAPVRDHREHRPEDLFLRDLHRVVDVGEDRRLDEEALAKALRRVPAADRPRALLLARSEVPRDPVALPRADDGPDVRGGVQRIAELHRADRGAEGLDDLLIAGTRREDSRLCTAGLAVIQERRAEQRLERRPEIDVLEDDRRRLAAELEGAASDQLAAEAPDAAAGGGAAREADLVDAGMADQILARLAARSDDVDDAGRKPDLLHRLGQ